LCSLVGCGISALSGRWEVTGAVIVFGIIAILFWVLLWAPAIALTRPGIGLSFLLSTTLALVPLHSLMAAYGVPRSPFAKGVPPLDSAVLATLLAIVGAMLPLAHVIAHRWLRGPHSRVERVVAAWTDGATELSGVQEPDADPVDLGPLLPWRPRVDHLAVAGAIEEGGAAGSEGARFLLDRLQSALDPQRPRASDGTRSSLVDVIPSPTPKSLSNWISVLQCDAPDAWPSRFVARFCLVLA